MVTRSRVPAVATLPFEIAQRRPGDIAESYADPSRAEAELGWTATARSTEMCEDTWRWQSQNPTAIPTMQ